MKAKLPFLSFFFLLSLEAFSQTTYQWYNLSFDLFGEYTVTTNNQEEFSGVMEGISFSIIPFRNQEISLDKISESVQNIAINQGVFVRNKQNIEYSSFHGIWLEGVLDADLVIMVGIRDKESNMHLYIILVLDNEYYKTTAEKFVYSIQKKM